MGASRTRKHVERMWVKQLCPHTTWGGWKIKSPIWLTIALNQKITKHFPIWNHYPQSCACAQLWGTYFNHHFVLITTKETTDMSITYTFVLFGIDETYAAIIAVAQLLPLRLIERNWAVCTMIALYCFTCKEILISVYSNHWQNWNI